MSLSELKRDSLGSFVVNLTILSFLLVNVILSSFTILMVKIVLFSLNYLSLRVVVTAYINIIL